MLSPVKSCGMKSLMDTALWDSCEVASKLMSFSTVPLFLIQQLSHESNHSRLKVPQEKEKIIKS